MSYQVFARKYRPQTFSEVVGQDHVTRTLENAIKLGRIAQAYLFVGPRGTGKTSMARILSKALNCPGGPRIDFDDKDPICQEISAGTSLDVLEIDGASNNGVEQVRDLRDKVRYAPVKGKYKIYYIDEVHMLTVAAFNALLKTLEEPPAHVKFIFATTEVHKLPATILSRCQRFDLRRIPDGLIAAHLQKICDLEEIKAEPAALETLARYAEGGLRDAEVALDQAVSFYGNKVNESEVLGMFGLTGLEPVAKLAQAIGVGDTLKALQVTRELIRSGKDLGRLTQDLMRFFRNITLHQLAPEVVSSELTPQEATAVAASSSLIPNHSALSLLDALSDLESRLRYASAKDVIFEVAMIQLCQLKEKVSLEAILQRVAAGGGASINSAPSSQPVSAPVKAAPVVASTPTPAPAPVSAPAPQPRTEVPAPVVESKPTPKAVLDPESIWKEAVERFAKERPMEESTLRAAKFLVFKSDTFEVGLPIALKPKLGYLLGPRNLPLIEESLSAGCGRPVKITFLLMEPEALPGGGAKDQSQEPPFKPLQNEDFTNDPLIREALELFQGRVIGTGKIQE